MPSTSAAGRAAGASAFRESGSRDSATRQRRPNVAEAATGLLRVRVELLVLGGLFLLTGAFGRTFSKLELGFSWLHPTEVVLGAVLVMAVLRTPTSQWMARLRSSGVLIPLLVLWTFGAIAALRGLTDWGFSLVLYDIGLVEYSLLIPILIIVVQRRSEFLWLCGAIAFSGLLGLIVYALTLWTPLQWDLANELNLIAPAVGMYLGIYVAWVLARSASDEPVRLWQYATVVLAVTLIIIGVARSAWLGCLAAVAIVLLFTPPGRRIVFPAMVIGLVAAGVALSIPANDFSIGEPPARTAGAVDGDGDLSDGGVGAGGNGDGRGVANEISSTFSVSSQSANSSWRLAFWGYMAEETAKQPIFGAGFGQPSAFEWEGTFYDRRTGNPTDPFDVTGPHNSFVNLLYRTGVAGLVALLAMVALAGVRLFKLARHSRGDDRAISIWLIAALTATIVVAGFTVALEGPFMGIYFWGLLALGLIAPQFLRRGGDESDVPAGTPA